MRYVVALLGVVGLFIAAGLLKNYVFEPLKMRDKRLKNGVEIHQEQSHLTVRWTKVKGYEEGVLLRLPREYKPGSSPTETSAGFQMRFDHIELWKTPPPFPPDMVAEIRQGYRTAEQANAWRERQRRWKPIQLVPADRLLEARRRFIAEAPQLLAGAHTEYESLWKQPRWPAGASPYFMHPDGMRAGFQRFSKKLCFSQEEIEARKDLAEHLRTFKPRSQSLPGNCALDRLNTVYISPADTPPDRWTTAECRGWARTCRVHFIAAGLDANLEIWEADLEILEQYTGPVRAVLAPWVTAKPLP